MAAGDAIRSAVPLSGLNQTSFLFGALILAFLFFITVRGDLAQWLGLLGLGGFPVSQTGNGGSTGSVTSGSINALPAAQNPFAGIPSLPSLGYGAAGGMT